MTALDVYGEIENAVSGPVRMAAGYIPPFHSMGNFMLVSFVSESTYMHHNNDPQSCWHLSLGDGQFESFDHQMPRLQLSLQRLLWTK